MSAPSSRDPRAVSASVSPNSVTDRPTTRDTLGFAPYVEAVAAFLLHKETYPPLTLSVEGAWGSGKSSFMLQLEERVRAGDAKTVWFNAWRHEREDELWAAFALDFTTKLAATVPMWQRWWLNLKLRCMRFDWRRGWLRVLQALALAIVFLFISVRVGQYLFGINSPVRQLLTAPASEQRATGAKTPEPPKWEEYWLRLALGAGGSAGYLLVFIAVLRRVSDVIGNPLAVQLTRYVRDPKYETRTPFIETFHIDFERLVHTYAQGKRVFVFIDDLDRCEVPKAADLMQALNLLISESAPVFYVLGLDREKIAAGLAAKYEKLLPYLSSKYADKVPLAVAGTEFGYAFLEKFVQLPFLVPRPNTADVEKLLDSLGSAPAEAQKRTGAEIAIDPGLLVEISADSMSFRNVVTMVAPAFEYNPRRVKQFVNLFRLRALLASQTGLFGSPRDPARFDSLTLQQLGKLVAITLRWPLLLIDLEGDPDLLSKLHARVMKPAPTMPLPGSAEEYWSTRTNLMELLALGTGETDTVDLRRVDIERFLQVAPIIRGRALTDRNKVAEQFGSVAAKDQRDIVSSAEEHGEAAHHASPPLFEMPSAPRSDKKQAPVFGDAPTGPNSESARNRVPADRPRPVPSEAPGEGRRGADKRRPPTKK